mgnify:CR=1 FL=1
MLRNILAGILLTMGAGLLTGAHALPPLQYVADSAPDSSETRWTPERIARDIIGHSVQIRDVDNRKPWSPWTFEADEPKDVDVVDTQVNGSRATVTIELATHDNLDTGEQTTYVSGRLRLRYERGNEGWQLRSIDNVSFRATPGGIST